MKLDYPKREPFFAHRFVRLMLRTCAAQEIGPVGFLLCTAIAHTEDAKRYTAPVTYWNEQLIPILGLETWGQLDRARKKAIEHGWLHYERHGKRVVGKYWVLIPPQFEALPDGVIDCDAHGLFHTSDDKSVTRTNLFSTSGEKDSCSPPSYSPLVKDETGMKRESNVNETGMKRESSSLLLSLSGAGADNKAADAVAEDFWNQAKTRALAIRDAFGGARAPARYRRKIAAYCYLVETGRMPADWLVEGIDGARANAKQSKWGYLWQSLRGEAAATDQDLEKIIATIKLPEGF